MDSQIANAIAQRIVENPVSRPFFQQAARFAFTDEPKTWVVISFTADGGLGLQQVWADDPSLEDIDCKIEFTSEALKSVAAGGACLDPPDVTGRNEGMARSLLMILGIEAANTQTGPGGVGQQGSSLDLARSMVYDAQLSADRRVFNPFTAREPGPYDARHWRIEAGVTNEGLHYAVSAGLTDAETVLRPRRPDSRTISGVGHELVLVTDAAGASGDWHVGVLATALRACAADDRPFANPDWIDWNRPLARGGTCEGFVFTESRWLESPFALPNNTWGRFFVMIGLCRGELDILNTQKEPRKILRVLEAELGNIEVTDPFRDPVNLW